jgi:hypothetical protein
MALIHDFYLAPTDLKSKRDIIEYVDSIKELALGHVGIHDDLINYMSDTLNWVPMKNTPFTKRSIEMGLDHYGMTILDEDSVTSLKEVLSGWKMIFSSAPKIIELTGSYYTIEGEDWEGEYEKLHFERDLILEQLNTLLSFIDEIEKNGHKIYHMGI